MMNCKQATRLLSDGQERPLTVAERSSLKFHTLMCTSCRRFQGQMGTLRQLAQSYAKGQPDEPEN